MEETTCHCSNLRAGVKGCFSWSDFDTLKTVEVFPEVNEYTLKCRACGSYWELTLDHIPVMPKYDWRELDSRTFGG